MQSFKNILMYPCSYCWTLQKQSILIADKLVINKSEIITATFSKSHLFINKVQSHVYLAGQSKQTKERHQRKERLSQLLWVAASALQFGACSVFPSNNALTDAGGSFSVWWKCCWSWVWVPPHRAWFCPWAAKENWITWNWTSRLPGKPQWSWKGKCRVIGRSIFHRQIKDDNAAVLFHIRFPSYED